MTEFSPNAPTANPTFYRTYSRRKEDGTRETWNEVVDRVSNWIARVGKLSNSEQELVRKYFNEQKSFASGRDLWVGGTEWIEKPENWPGAYNCNSTEISDPRAFGLLMGLAMMGVGTGAVLTEDAISQLPVVGARFGSIEISQLGTLDEGQPNTSVTKSESGAVYIVVGDSRQGWVDAYQHLIDIAFSASEDEVNFIIDLSQVRKSGSKLKGFGGTANPVALPETFSKVFKLLKGAYGRKLDALECCLLVDYAAEAVVAGNVRRSAGMRQGSPGSALENCKAGLWTEVDGKWLLDPAKGALRMANHTIVYNKKPSYEVVLSSVEQQYYSGEGAIQYAPEAIKRSNADNPYWELGDEPKNVKFDRSRRFGLNPCGEIAMHNNFCNLSEVHLSTLLDATDREVEEAFTAAALIVCSHLQRNFVEERYKRSRDLDPIVAVCITGLFDFFAHRLGADWVAWMMSGRQDCHLSRALVIRERGYLSMFRGYVNKAVTTYCIKHGIRRPNRTTAVQPSGTKSLITNSCPGWHPPKGQYFIRRITFGREDPVAMACIDYGYKVVPNTNTTKPDGGLYDDIWDPNVEEWLVEIPVKTHFADVPGIGQVDLSKMPIEGQFGLAMQVQNYYVEHNLSSTLEFTKEEIPTLAKLIHDAMGNGYVSAALLARPESHHTFPRMPFEVISKEEYETLNHAAEKYREATGNHDFHALLQKYDSADLEIVPENACTSGVCEYSALMEERRDITQVAPGDMFSPV